jgi:hypothetical protein
MFEVDKFAWSEDEFDAKVDDKGDPNGRPNRF